MTVSSSGHVNRLNLIKVPLISTKNTTIPYVPSVKNLGIIFNSIISWNKQVGNICKSVYATFHQLKTIKRALAIKLRTHLFFDSSSF